MVLSYSLEQTGSRQTINAQWPFQALVGSVDRAIGIHPAAATGSRMDCPAKSGSILLSKTLSAAPMA